jgi:hypothetical protein
MFSFYFWFQRSSAFENGKLSKNEQLLMYWQEMKNFAKLASLMICNINITNNIHLNNACNVAPDVRVKVPKKE